MKAQYVDHMGDDLAVVNAARVSFEMESWYIGEEYVPDSSSRHAGAWASYITQHATRDDLIGVGDYGLIQYLANHGHWTPFAHVTVKLRMKAPVPIRTQCFKHKSGFVENEESRRYIKSRPEVFIPTTFRSAPENAKQGSAGTHPRDAYWRARYTEKVHDAVDEYIAMVEDGIAPEQARYVLPQGAQVNWIWTGSLAAFARFFGLRNDSHAQGEIQELARDVGSIIKPLFPVSWEALTT